MSTCAHVRLYPTIRALSPLHNNRYVSYSYNKIATHAVAASMHANCKYMVHHRFKFLKAATESHNKWK